MIEGILIRQLPAKTSQSGQAFQWCAGVPGQQVTFYMRRSGTVSGNHYHLGDDASKNPERFVLLTGEGKLIACDGRHTIEVHLTAFTEVLISPRIVHALLATTPVFFAEYRQTIYDPEHPDTYGADTFEEQLKRTAQTIDAHTVTVYFDRVKSFSG